MKVLKYVSLKGNNKRIKVGLVDNKGDLIFVQETKTLTDFKTRTIVETNCVYSVETFSVLCDVFSRFMQNSEIKNKILHKELSKIKKFKGVSNF